MRSSLRRTQNQVPVSSAVRERADVGVFIWARGPRTAARRSREQEGQLSSSWPLIRGDAPAARAAFLQSVMMSEPRQLRLLRGRDETSAGPSRLCTGHPGLHNKAPPDLAADTAPTVWGSAWGLWGRRASSHKLQSPCGLGSPGAPAGGGPHSTPLPCCWQGWSPRAVGLTVSVPRGLSAGGPFAAWDPPGSLSEQDSAGAGGQARQGPGLSGHLGRGHVTLAVFRSLEAGLSVQLTVGGRG